MICTQEDSYTEEQFDLGQARWVVELSDGRKVYQDDYRPGLIPSAWVRLRNYLSGSGLRIVRMFLQFRDNVHEPSPAQAEGYFFSKSIVGVLGAWQANYYLVGHVSGGKLHVQKWKVPELLLEGSEVRDIQVGESLIMVNDVATNPLG